METVILISSIVLAIYWTRMWVLHRKMSVGHSAQIICAVMLWGVIAYFVFTPNTSKYNMLWAIPIAFLGSSLVSIPYVRWNTSLLEEKQSLMNTDNSFATSKLSTSSFANELYAASTSWADTGISNGKVNENCRSGLTLEFLHGLLHMTDRYAHAVIPGRRAEFMDQLLPLCYGKLIESFSESNLSAVEKQKLLETACDEFNEISSFYGTCKELFPEGDNFAGTFFWEFGKRFASAANHNMDFSFIVVGSELLAEALKQLNIPERLSA